MIAIIRRWLCRTFHGGFAFKDGRCQLCGTVFNDSREAGRLEEFVGRVTLDECRLLDEEDKRIRTLQVYGWRVYNTNTLQVLKVWGTARNWPPPEKKEPMRVIRPIKMPLQGSR